MGKFDKEIKKAEQIGRDWTKKSKSYQGKFVDLKKQNMKWEKDTITSLQKSIQKGEHNTPLGLKSIIGEIDTIKDRLKEFKAFAKREFDEHEKWALSEPRSSMRAIDSKLKLGGVKSEAYNTVAQATKRQMTDVAGELRSTQRAYKDVAYALDTMGERIKGIEAIVRDGKSKQSAWIGQIRSEAKGFVDYCDHEMRNYGHKANELADIAKGAKDDKWDERTVKQQIQLATAKAKQAPAIIKQIEKNHGRVLKSVPKEFMNGFMTSSEKKAMEEKKEATIARIKQTQAFWVRYVKTVRARPAFKEYL